MRGAPTGTYSGHGYVAHAKLERAPQGRRFGRNMRTQLCF